MHTGAGRGLSLSRNQLPMPWSITSPLAGQISVSPCCSLAGVALLFVTSVQALRELCPFLPVSPLSPKCRYPENSCRERVESDLCSVPLLRRAIQKAGGTFLQLIGLGREQSISKESEGFGLIFGH